MYRAFGNIVCDNCLVNVNDMIYITVKGKESILHFCCEECRNKHNIKKNEN